MSVGRALNTPSVANSGAALVAASTAVLGSAIAGHPVAPYLLALALAGGVLGAVLCYLGRPSTISPAPAPGKAPAMNILQILEALFAVYDTEFAKGGAKQAADKIQAVATAAAPIIAALTAPQPSPTLTAITAPQPTTGA